MSKPNATEIEVSLFGGQKQGESQVIHLGDNNWMIVDSFRGIKTQTPIALDYLASIEVPFENVKVIVLTHYHRDHSKGIVEIAAACPNAEVWIPSVFDGASFLVLLKKLVRIKNTKFNPLLDLNELFEKDDKGEIELKRCKQDLVLYSSTIGSNSIEVIGLSPNDKTIRHFEKEIKKVIDEGNEISKMVDTKDPNYQSIALLVKTRGFNILLTGDLEDHDANIGLQSILNSKLLGNEKSKVFKVPHHGSENGYNKKVWSHFAENDDSFLITTPIKTGSTVLPENTMIDRLKTQYKLAYITADPYDDIGGLKHKENTRRILKDLNLNIKKNQDFFGQIRIRKDVTKKEAPRCELFDKALKI